MHDTDQGRPPEDPSRDPSQALSLLRSTLESTADGVLVTDHARRVVYYNQRFVQMWRLPTATLERGDSAEALAVAVDQVRNRSAFLQRLEEIHAHPEDESSDVLELTDGRVFERHAIPQREHGRPIGRVWTFRDVTDRKRAEDALLLSTRFNDEIINSAAAGIVVLNRQLRYLVWNPLMEELTGLRAEHVIGRHLLELFPDAQADGLQRLLEAALRGETVRSAVAQLQMPQTGRRGWVVGTYSPHRSAQGDVIGVIGVVRDITQHKQAEDALRESEERFRRLAETAPCAIIIYQGTRFRYANAALSAITGYTWEDLDRIPFYDMVTPDLRDTVRERGLARQRGEPVPNRYEIKVACKDGSVIWLDYSAGVIEFEGQPAVLGTAFDITERKRAEEQVRNLAYHDVLTGLPNRLLFHDRLAVAVAQAHRYQQRLAVLFLDLDRFKVINDSLGHSLGDRLLQAVARRLTECVREGDTVARLGGDEFTLLLPVLQRPVDVAGIAEKILEALKQPFRLEARDLYITASMGVALFPDDGRDAETLVKNADAAMYRAKEQGRDNYQLYAPGLTAMAVERLAIEGNLRRAVAQHELALHYQPIVDARTGHVHGVEALLRWPSDGETAVPTGELIALAEVTGLIVAIGSWVLRSACVQARAWQAEGMPELCVSINLSARQLQQPDLTAQVRRILDETGLAPGCLDLEITESSAMQNAEASIHTLRELKAFGVRISIDDFGIGHSSLAYLKRLPIDSLKIDRSFVSDITTDPDDAAIATAVIALARTLRLQVVAEGVETAAQRAFLVERQCDRMQGYLVSPPLPAAECGRFLAAARGDSGEA